jgi:hypothetical protein
MRLRSTFCALGLDVGGLPAARMASRHVGCKMQDAGHEDFCFQALLAAISFMLFVSALFSIFWRRTSWPFHT